MGRSVSVTKYRTTIDFNFVTRIEIDLDTLEFDLERYRDLLAEAPEVEVPLRNTPNNREVVNLQTYSRFHARRFLETGRAQELQELDLCLMAWRRWQEFGDGEDDDALGWQYRCPHHEGEFYGGTRLDFDW